MEEIIVDKAGKEGPHLKGSLEPWNISKKSSNHMCLRKVNLVVTKWAGIGGRDRGLQAA